jgi:hypothetical protein
MCLHVRYLRRRYDLLSILLWRYDTCTNPIPRRSYTGSLKYRQACRSVVIIHKLEWVQHYHSLLVSEGPNQNYVEVERDFSNLDAKIMSLTVNQEEAKRIAYNNVRTFRERYLTPAAEACYWRKLIKTWREASFEPELYETVKVKVSSSGDTRFEQRKRGMRWEAYW